MFQPAATFQALGGRKLVADFSGGLLSSDGGALLLGQVESSLGISRSLAACFTDRRVPELVVHSVRELLAQRVNALALGYEDLHDHARLRLDPFLAAAGKEDVLGVERIRSEHRGAALASPATLNARLEAMLEPAMAAARARHILCASTTHSFAELRYRTLDSWSCERRVIGKAEAGARGDNPRFIVTNVPLEGLRGAVGETLIQGGGSSLYEELYCERGNAENRIKQMTLELHSGRTSTHWLASNQMRLWLSAFACLLLERLRAWGLAGSELATATLGTVRLRLLKVAAQITVSVRRVYVQMSSAFPPQTLFARCQQRLAAMCSG